MAGLALLPLGYLLVRSSEIGWDRVRRASPRSARVRGLLWRTGLLAGVRHRGRRRHRRPVAWLTVRTDLPLRRFWVVASALPLAIPTYVGGYAFIAALGPRGILQDWLEPVGVESLPSFYGFGGAWLVLTLFTYPYVLLTVRSAIRGLDPGLEEASRLLGRGRWATFRHVVLPQLRPSIAAGALLVALYTLSDFGAVSMLRFDSFTRAIFVQYRASLDRSTAAVLGLVLVARHVGRAHRRVGGRGGRHGYHRLHAGGARRAPGRAARTLAVAGLRGAVRAAHRRARRAAGRRRQLVRARPRRRRAAAPHHDAHRQQPEGRRPRRARRGGVRRGRWRSSRCGGAAGWPAWWSARAGSGHSLPGVVVALSLVFFGARVVPRLYQTQWMLTLAYVVLFLPQALGAIRAALLQISPSMEEASRLLGPRLAGDDLGGSCCRWPARAAGRRRARVPHVHEGAAGHAAARAHRVPDARHPGVELHVRGVLRPRRAPGARARAPVGAADGDPRACTSPIEAGTRRSVASQRADDATAAGASRSAGVAQALRRRARAARRRPRTCPRARGRAARPQRLRQDHAAADDRRARADRRRHASPSPVGRWPGDGRRRPPGAPPRRHGVPGLGAVPAPRRGRQRRATACPKRERSRRAHRAGARARGPAGHGRPLAVDAVGRPAAAGRPRPGDRAGAVGAPARRAVLEPRHRAAGAGAHRAARPARRPRGHDRVRHPRPGGGVRARATRSR